ncbi:adhesion G-protein coupled receptor G6-like [Octopus vulgaris]|uniref:Adhesion G-protein coupled receptor G6-like n=1 Tax=Octopus vulgaris TaxID=6645 RepID=A0AA36C0V0_OCTVU|nr:adhesion G-protein coupled receptor G6-like [Octopus vulgaris]
MTNRILPFFSDKSTPRNMFQQLKLTFVLILSMSFCLESHAASDICSICKCENSKTRIDCSSRQLTSIPQPIPPNVENLYLYSNNIKYIQRGSFENLPNLEQLNLNDNDITYIQRGSFENLPNLGYLYLENNQIQNYEDGAFLFLPSINIISSGEMVGLEMPTNQYGTSPKGSSFTGVWQEPDMSQCYNTERITQQLKNITSEDINEENVEEVSTILSNISKKAVYFKAEDIDLAVDIQEKILPLISNVPADITLTNILLSINNMIDTPEEILVEAEQSGGTVSRMLDIIEAITEEIPLEGQQLTALYSNLGIGVIKVEKYTFNGAVYGISFGNNGTEAMTTVIQKSRTKANAKIYSTVIAASIPNIRITNLDEPLTYDETHPICKRIVIKHFIKLKKIQRIFTSYQTLAVEYRLSFSFLQNLRKLMASKILVCLCISLAVSNLIFLVGMQEYATTKPAACKAVAALIHYFLMTSLMWMTVEVLHVCLAVDVISQTVQRSFMIRSSILAWDVGYQRDRSILLLWLPWGSFSSSTFLSSLLMSRT